jgi:hypothetical protein
MNRTPKLFREKKNMGTLNINTRLYSTGKLKILGGKNKTQIRIEPD